MRGVIEASSEVTARRQLREQKLLPLAVKASAAPLASQAVQPLGLQRFRGRIGAKALATITRQLSTLIGSDVRIEEALRLVSAQAPNARAGALLLDVRGAILDGRSLASALGDHPSVFPEFYRASIAAGESSGRLPGVLAHLADFVERRQRNANKVRLALLYPALLAGVAVLMITLLLIYVVPSIVRVFATRGAELPWLTRALIGLSEFVQNYGLVVLILLLLGGFLSLRWLKRDENRLRLHRAVATRRPTSGFSRQINAARFGGSLATLVQSGVPLVDALAGAAAVTPNLYVRRQAEGVAARVREGSSLNRAMADAAVFPPMLTAIVASGESSGRLGDSLGKASADLDRDTEAMAATLVALVEPAVLLFMGGIVLLLVLAILLPIISLNALATI